MPEITEISLVKRAGCEAASGACVLLGFYPRTRSAGHLSSLLQLSHAFVGLPVAT